jgi:hypothetical protein
MIEIFTSLGASISWNSYFFSPATLFRNRPLYILIFTAITLQLLILKLEAYLLGTADLTFKENALCILFGIGSLFPCAIASVLSRFMPIKHWFIFHTDILSLKGGNSIIDGKRREKDQFRSCYWFRDYLARSR